MHDMLVVNSGPALVRTTVKGVVQALPDDAATPVKGIDDPVVLALTFDDLTQSLLAAPASARTSLEGLTKGRLPRRSPPAEDSGASRQGH